jgi:diketogulonate reductase-like aldo/keto reductase
MPKSTNPEHVRSNFKALDVHITEEDIEEMKWKDEKKYCWDPKKVA